MKTKFFFGMLAAAGVLSLASCSRETLSDKGGEAEVRLNLGIENIVGTKAISDGQSADKLVYAVFDAKGARVSSIEQVVREGVTFPTTEVLTLAKGQTYKVAFWAQDADCTAYTVSDDMQVSIDYTGVNNDETRDAFFKTEEIKVSGDQSLSVVLKRPFAQINLGVTAEDLEFAQKAGISIAESSAEIHGVANTLNVLDGTVSGNSIVKYSLSALPEDALKVDLDKDGVKEEYTWLSMSYILPSEPTTGAAKTTVSCLSFNLEPESGNPVAVSEGLFNVPVQRNWRTNIIGRVLTGNIDVTISIDPAFEDDYNNEKYDSWVGVAENVPATVDGVVTITTAQQLADLAAAVNAGNSYQGVTVTLGADIDLLNKLWTRIGEGDNLFRGNFDGQNHKISNLTIRACQEDNESRNNRQALFGKAQGSAMKNVVIENVDIRARSIVAALVGENMWGYVENVTLQGDVQISANGAVGGIWGRCTVPARMKDITVNVNPGSKIVNISDGAYTGGVTGQVWLANAENIKSNIDVFARVCYVGGIAGMSDGGTWQNVACSGNVTVDDVPDDDNNQYYSAKLFGTRFMNYKVSTMNKCTATGTLTINLVDKETGEATRTLTNTNGLKHTNTAGEEFEDGRFGCKYAYPKLAEGVDGWNITIND